MGDSHFNASLAYLMASEERRHGMTRKDAMENPDFAQHFVAKRTYLRGLRVATVAISNPIELCVFEVYAAMMFRTARWNTFRTH
jgi:hypothetical protein